MEIYLLAGITVLTLIILKHLIGNRTTKLLSKIPGPTPLPIIGNFFDLERNTHEIADGIIKKFKKYGPIYRLYVGGLPVVTTRLPEYVEVILSSTKEIKKGFMYRLMQPWLGEGLLISQGQRWHQHRKLITPTFHFSILESFVPIFESKSDILIEKLKIKLQTQEVFDIYPLITLCALDIICETAMGTNLRAQEESETNEYLATNCKIVKLITDRFPKFYLYSDNIYHNTKDGKEFLRCLKIVHGFTENVIRERRALRQTSEKPSADEDEWGKKKRKAFLDLLLDSATYLSDEDLRQEVDTFMFAGHDTTTAAVCWAIYLLGRHQDIQDKVVEEIQRSAPKGENLTLQNVGEMKLLERVVKEALRIYPSAAIINRELQNDLKLGDYVIPARTVISVPIIAMHRDETLFPDPMKFNPDRFLPENIRNSHPYAFVPFSAGPRNCIGQKFALLEEKAIIANLLRHYKIFSVRPQEEMEECCEIVTRPRWGVQVQIQLR